MKPLMTILVMLIASASYLFGFGMFEKAEAMKKAVGSSRSEEVQQVNDPVTMKVYLRRIYMDGQVIIEKKTVKMDAMDDFRSKHSGWTVVKVSKDSMVLKKKIHDLSPILKTDGYFGLSKKGILTIYEGKPDKNDAIHSFFQIDVNELESRVEKELKQGIPVESKGHYEEVMKALKKYASKHEQ